jgi:spore germination cell wall hydrolase CwlJ-like protein
VGLSPKVRALIGATAVGALAGLAMGGAYLGGSISKLMAVRAEAKRLTPAAEANFATSALIAASGVDQSALSIARRHDPYTVAGPAERDREAILFAARLEPHDAPQARPMLRQASFLVTPAARPFHMAGAFEASRDLDCLTQAVYYEARGEGQTGMQAVAQVVLNRVRHPAFPKSVCAVVYQGAAEGACQFSFACDGSARRAVETEAWSRSRNVAARALAGYVMAEVGNATHFHTISVTPGWRADLLRVAQVGSHIFYRFGGGQGAPEAFRYTPRPSTTGAPQVRPVMAGFVPPSAGTDAAPYTVLFKAPEVLKADAPGGAVKIEEPMKAPDPAPAAPAAGANSGQSN